MKRVPGYIDYHSVRWRCISCGRTWPETALLPEDAGYKIPRCPRCCSAMKPIPEEKP